MKAKRHVQIVALKRDKESILNHLTAHNFRFKKSEFVSCANYDSLKNGEINEISAHLSELDALIANARKNINLFSTAHITAVIQRLRRKSAVADLVNRIKGVSIVNIEAIEERLADIEERLAEIEKEKSERLALINSLMPYAQLNVPFSMIQNTAHTKMTVGLLPSPRIFELTSEAQKHPLCNIVLLLSDTNYKRLGKRSAERGFMVLYVAGMSGFDELVAHAESLGFVHCEHKFDSVPIKLIDKLRAEVGALESETQFKMEQLMDCFQAIRRYTKFLQHKQQTLVEAAGMIVTSKTFFIEGDYPVKKEAEVLGGLYRISNTLEITHKDA